MVATTKSTDILNVTKYLLVTTKSTDIVNVTK